MIFLSMLFISEFAKNVSSVSAEEKLLFLFIKEVYFLFFLLFQLFFLWVAYFAYAEEGASLFWKKIGCVRGDTGLCLRFILFVFGDELE